MCVVCYNVEIWAELKIQVRQARLNYYRYVFFLRRNVDICAQVKE